METFLVNNVHAYGPLAVFLLLMLTGVGVPLGEELIVIPAGALVEHGELAFWPTVVAAYLGVLASDCMWFHWSYRYGTRLLHKRAFKRLVHPRRLLEAKHQMEERGAWMIVMSRFVPGSRTTAITVAGLLHMPFWRFAATTAACACLTVPLQVGIGVLGAKVIEVRNTAELIRLVASLVVLTIGILMVLALWRQHKLSKRRAPRAKARWLRRFRIPRGARRGGGRPRRPVAGTQGLRD